MKPMSLKRIFKVLQAERDLLEGEQAYLENLRSLPDLHPDNITDILRQSRNTRRRIRRLTQHPKVLELRAYLDRQVEAHPNDKETIALRTYVDIEVDGY